ncbi:unnamed protein product, partial [Rotaria magnacalcarata]
QTAYLFLIIGFVSIGTKLDRQLNENQFTALEN